MDMESARSLTVLRRRWRRDAEIGWLSLTPEPERELPPLVAALRSRDPRDLSELLERERLAVEEIVLRGRERDWLRYLSDAVHLVLDSPEVGLSEAQRAAALDVLANHHRLLLGLPGDAAERTESERAALERAIAADEETDQANPNGGP
jgi:hypothetical protein